VFSQKESDDKGEAVGAIDGGGDGKGLKMVDGWKCSNGTQGVLYVLWKSNNQQRAILGNKGCTLIVKCLPVRCLHSTRTLTTTA